MANTCADSSRGLGGINRSGAGAERPTLRFRRGAAELRGASDRSAGGARHGGPASPPPRRRRSLRVSCRPVRPLVSPLAGCVGCPSSSHGACRLRPPQTSLGPVSADAAPAPDCGVPGHGGGAFKSDPQRHTQQGTQRCGQASGGTQCNPPSGSQLGPADGRWPRTRPSPAQACQTGDPLVTSRLFRRCSFRRSPTVTNDKSHAWEAPPRWGHQTGVTPAGENQPLGRGLRDCGLQSERPQMQHWETCPTPLASPFPTPTLLRLPPPQLRSPLWLLLLRAVSRGLQPGLH